MRSRSLPAVAALALMGASAAAHAFCGTYVGSAGSEIYNQVSEVALVRSGNRTTLTLYNDVQGDTEEFAMLVPVPEVPGAEDLHTISPEVFDRLDRYSAPRRVRYDCEDFRPVEGDADTDTDTDGDTDTDTDTDWDVDVEAEYIVGEYDLVVLSAGAGGDLEGWLDEQGFVLPRDEDGILDEYIAGGSYFLAARIHEDADIASGERLSPLQLSYETEALTLPIRIGTLSAQGEQDVLIYAFTDYSTGRLGISNYSEVEVEEGCMWGQDLEYLDTEVFGYFYGESFADAVEGAGGAAWATEYAWGGGGCDPCEGTPPDGNDLLSLGVPEEQAHYSDYFFTRLHARYSPEQADEDFVLYGSGITGQHQQRYIDYLHELEDRFPICGLGFPSDPGTCDFDGDEGDDGDGGSDGGGDGGGGSAEDLEPAGDETESKGGCSSIPLSPGFTLALLPLLALGRRRP